MKIDMLVPPNVLKVYWRLNKFNYQAFLVGGCVRDTILGHTPKDWDVATDATPDQIKEVFDWNCRIVGRRFPIAHVLFKGEYIEVSTFRTDSNDYGTMVDDCHRRDYTVNALYYDVSTKEVIDPFGGLAHLLNRTVVCIGSPSKRFVDDPIRMVRAARLTKLGLKLPKLLRQDIRTYSRLLATVNYSRLYLEFEKIFSSGSNQSSVALTLDGLHLLERFFPRKMWRGVEPWYGDCSISEIISVLVWDYYQEFVIACMSEFNISAVHAHKKAAKLLIEELRQHMNMPVYVSSDVKRLLRERYVREYL